MFDGAVRDGDHDDWFVLSPAAIQIQVDWLLAAPTSASHMDDAEFQKAVTEFIGAFEVVFRYDWSYTTTMFGVVEDGGTFVEPGLEDESDDWGARGVLLKKYRRLVAVMQTRGLEPIFPFPLDRLPGFTKRAW